MAVKLELVLLSLVKRGGMVHYQAQLANALAELTPTTVVVPEAVAQDYFSDAVQLIRFRSGFSRSQTRRRLLDPRLWFDLRRKLKEAGADLFHLTAPYVGNLPLLLILPSAPLFYTVHDPQPHRGERLVVRKIDFWVRRRAAAFFVHSPAGQETLKKQGFSQPSFVVPHGDYAFFRRWARPGMRSKKIILFFGRLEPYKGLDLLLKVLPQFWKQEPQWRVVIAGAGDFQPYQKLCPRDERLILKNRFIADEEVAPLFQEAAFVVLPYHEATQSGIIPIAYAFAKPVVATRVGGLPEVVEDGKTGILINPSSPEELLNAMLELARNPSLRRRLGQAAQRKMERDLSWAAIARRHLQAYCQVLHIT